MSSAEIRIVGGSHDGGRFPQPWSADEPVPETVTQEFVKWSGEELVRVGVVEYRRTGCDPDGTYVYTLVPVREPYFPGGAP